MEKQTYLLGTLYHLSTDGYSFKYREDRYNPKTIRVDLFKDGQIVHRQMAKSIDYNINLTHHQIINELEAKIKLGELDQSGLKQIVNP